MRRIGIGYILRRLVCKVILIVEGNEVARACDTDELCSGLETDIEGGEVITFEPYERCMN